MTLCPFAAQHLTPVNFTHGGVVRPPHGMVIHTAVGTEAGTDGYEDNPTAHVSSYFIVGQDGSIIQKVDLDNRAWTQAAGNAAWIGVENEGNPTVALTRAQVAANGRIFAWLHSTYGMPLQLTDDPINGRGLGYHQMGGVAWSPAHHQCPGPLIVAQRPAILAAALAIVGKPPAPPKPRPPAHTVDLGDIVPKITDQTITLGANGDGYFDIPGVSDPDVISWGVIGMADPQTHGYPRAVPDVYFTLNNHGVDRFVVIGGTPGQTVTVRVAHA